MFVRDEGYKVVESALNEIEATPALKQDFLRLKTDPVQITFVPRPSGHVHPQVPKGAKTVTDWNLFTDGVTVEIYFNLDDLKEQAKVFGLEITLAQAMAHELGHAFFDLFVAKKTTNWAGHRVVHGADQMGNCDNLAVKWENKMRDAKSQRDCHNKVLHPDGEKRCP